MKKIKNTYTIADIAIIVGIILVGCAFLPFGTGWRELGLIIAACGVCTFPFLKRGYRIEGESDIFKLKEIAVSRNDKSKIINFLNDENAVPDFKNVTSGGALISIYKRKDKIFAQYFDHVEVLDKKEIEFVKITSEQYDKLLNLSK